jgi:glutathione S-transferase
MKLYYNPLSTYSQKALIALYEKGVTFDRELVNLMTPEGRAAYEAVYPLGKIPLLQTAPDHNIPESTIIIEYLEGHHPGGTRLIPAGIDAARQARFMDRMGDLYLNDPAVTLLFEKLGFRKHTPEALDKATKYLNVTYAHLDQRLATQDWVCGSEFTIADCAAIPPLFYAQFAAPFSDHANVRRYFERAKARPSYARVMAEFVPIWEGMQAQNKPT